MQDERQLREALDNLRLISDTVQRTRKETLRCSADSFIVWGLLMLAGFSVSIFLSDWLVEVWWVLVGLAIVGSMALLKARQGSSLSKSGRWLLRRYAIIWLGFNAQGWAFTLLATLYHAYPTVYIPVVWMIIIGVSFIINGLLNYPGLIIIGLLYVATGTLTAIFQPNSAAFGNGLIIIGMVSSVGLIGMGLFLRWQVRGRSSARLNPSLKPSEAVSR